MAETVTKRKVRLATSARLLGFVEPMKARLVESLPSGNWIYEIKFDGYRALALRGGSEVRVLSRNEKDLGGKFPEVPNSIAALDVQDAIIDGEIVALDEGGGSSFQLLQAFEMGQERPPIVFYAFDLLQLNGKDLRNLPVETRKARLEELLSDPPGVIRYSPPFDHDVKELLARARELGLEGLIAKRRDSRTRLANEAVLGSSSSSNWSKISLSAVTPNRKEPGSILVRCWWASLKTGNSNLLAELELGSVKSCSEPCILNSMKFGSANAPFLTSRQLAEADGTEG
jgi:ATP dependent DNA ligase domain